MKKILAAVLSLAMALSLASCNKKPAESGKATSGASSAPIASKKQDSTHATTQHPNPADKYVKHKIEKITIPGFTDDDGEQIEEEDVEFHLPEVLIKSTYADSINKEISKAFDGYKAEFKKDGATDCGGSEYIAYLVKDEILSLVFIELGPNDTNDYHVYNIDIKTGEKVDNARIAKYAGVSSIRKAAMDALAALYNTDENENFKIKDYKVVKDNGEPLDEEERAVEKSFSEKYLNDNMMVGLTDEGKIFFISEAETGAGAFFLMYDEKGKFLYDEDNPCRVGYIYEDDDEEEGDEGDEGDEDLPDDEN